MQERAPESQGSQQPDRTPSQARKTSFFEGMKARWQKRRRQGQQDESLSSSTLVENASLPRQRETVITGFPRVLSTYNEALQIELRQFNPNVPLDQLMQFSPPVAKEKPSIWKFLANRKLPFGTIYLKKGLELVTEGFPEEAIRAFDQAQQHYSKNRLVDTQSDRSDVLVYQGHVLADLGRAVEAVASLSAAITLEGPYTAYAHYLKGAILYDMSRFDEAVRAFDTAVQMGIGDDRSGGLEYFEFAQLSKAKALDQLGRYDEAAVSRSKAALSRAGAYEKKGKYEESLRELDIVISFDTQNSNTLYEKARILSSYLGRNDEALLVCNRAFQLGSQEECNRILGEAEKLYGEGNVEEARAKFEKAKGLSGGLVEMKIRLLQNMGRGKEIETWIELNRPIVRYEEAGYADNGYDSSDYGNNDDWHYYRGRYFYGDRNSKYYKYFERDVDREIEVDRDIEKKDAQREKDERWEQIEAEQAREVAREQERQAIWEEQQAAKAERERENQEYLEQQAEKDREWREKNGDNHFWY